MQYGNQSRHTSYFIYNPINIFVCLCLAVILSSITALHAEENSHGKSMMERMKHAGQAMPDKSSRPGGLAVTVLGSGGPMAMTDRASAGYVIYLDTVPRIMVDGGGGTFERLGEARIFDLARMDTWLFTHLHIDHSAEFPAIIKSMYFLRRGYNKPTPLTVVGPDAWGDFPSTSEFVDAFFNKKDGIYRYLHNFLKTVKAGDLDFETQDLEYDYEEVKSPQVALNKDGVRISYIPVMHGPRESKTPAVAFRIDYEGHSITISGDLNADTGNLVKLAKGSDVLIYDAALGPAQNFPPPDLFHPLPSEIGKSASEAGVKTLVLSHFMPPYIPMKIDRIESAVKDEYKGEVILAKDMMTLGAARGNAASTDHSDSSDAEDEEDDRRKGPMRRFMDRMQD